MSFNKNLFFLIMSQSITVAGDQLYNIAILWVITELTGSAKILANIMTVMVISNIVSSLFSGVLIDRYNKKALLVISDVVRASLVFILVILFYLGKLSIFYLFFMVVGMGAATSIFAPAIRSIIPLLFAKDQLLRINSSIAVTNRGISTIVPAMGGALISIIGIPIALLIDVISFLFCSCLILFLKIPYRYEHESKKFLFMDEIREGIQIAISNKPLLIILISASVINLADALLVIYPMFLKNELSADIVWFGIINASVPAGLFCVNFIFIYFNDKINSIFALFIGMLFQAIGIMLFSLSNNLYFSTFFFFLFGMGMAGFNTTVITLIQQATEEKYIGRMFSLYNMIAMALMPLGYSISGILSEHLDSRIILFISGFIIFTVFLILLIMQNSTVNIMLSKQHNING